MQKNDQQLTKLYLYNNGSYEGRGKKNNRYKELQQVWLHGSFGISKVGGLTRQLVTTVNTFLPSLSLLVMI